MSSKPDPVDSHDIVPETCPRLKEILDDLEEQVIDVGRLTGPEKVWFRSAMEEVYHQIRDEITIPLRAALEQALEG